MKISELANKSFLGAAGAAANSYVLINYEDNTISEPVTYKATLQELGKAIANDQQLYKKTVNGAITTSVNNNAYANGTAEKLITSTEKEMLEKMRYYTTQDSLPHLELTGANPATTAEVITAAGYTDPNFNEGQPVVYNTTTNTLKYIDLNKTLQNVSVGAPTSISNIPVVLYDSANEVLKYYDSTNTLVTLQMGNEGGAVLPSDGVYVIDGSEGYELFNPVTNSHTPIDAAIYPSGAYKVILDANDYKYKIAEPANNSDIPRTFAEIAAKDGITSYDGVEGTPIFVVQDSVTETTYLAYASVGSSTELIPVSNVAYITTSNGTPAICDAAGTIIGLLTSPD